MAEGVVPSHGAMSRSPRRRSEHSLQLLRSVHSEREFGDILHPATLLCELATTDACSRTAIQWLRGIFDDERSHLVVGMDERFSIQMLSRYQCVWRAWSSQPARDGSQEP